MGGWIAQEEIIDGQMQDQTVHIIAMPAGTITHKATTTVHNINDTGANLWGDAEVEGTWYRVQRKAGHGHWFGRYLKWPAE